MSWKTINRILGQAAIDSAFRQRLLEDPPTALAAEGFELTPEEQEALTQFSALSFPEFCWRSWDQTRVRESAGKRAGRAERRKNSTNDPVSGAYALLYPGRKKANKCIRFGQVHYTRKGVHTCFRHKRLWSNPQDGTGSLVYWSRCLFSAASCSPPLYSEQTRP